MIPIDVNSGEVFGSSGVLPVSNDEYQGNSVDLAHDGQKNPISDELGNPAERSMLLAFTAGSPSAAKADPSGAALMHFITHNATLQEDGKVLNKPSDHSTLGATTGGDLMPIFGYDEFYFDPFGSNEPSYGLPVVYITAEAEVPAWESFPVQSLSWDEYIFIENGGSDSGGSSDRYQQVNWHFIENLEGNELHGYIPKDNAGKILGRSGVTIASGFDLGSKNMNELKTLGLDDALIAKLEPYLGLKGEQAEHQLAQIPLHVTADEATAINSASHAATLSRIVVAYDASAGAGSFYGLPAAAQTVLASVSFQYFNLAANTPVFWSQVTSQDWTGAVATLRDFGDAYDSRHEQEADLLQSAINAGTL